jgi:hypothetical protein
LEQLFAGHPFSDSLLMLAVMTVMLAMQDQFHGIGVQWSLPVAAVLQLFTGGPGGPGNDS